MQRKFTCEEENLLGCEHKQHGIEIKNEVARCQVGSVNKMFRTCPILIINAKKHSKVDKQILFDTLPVGLGRKPWPFFFESE